MLTLRSQAVAPRMETRVAPDPTQNKIYEISFDHGIYIKDQDCVIFLAIYVDDGVIISKDIEKIEKIEN